jgi:uncharacterized protein (DUF305 family)
MNNTTILAVLAALLVGGIGGYAMSSFNSHYNSEHRHMSGNYDDRGYTQKSPSSGQSTMGMMGGHDMHTDMMVSSEREFIEHMIPHHEEAINTAKEVLARGATTPEIKTLMENIISAQEKEVADMKGWYQNWYNTPYVDKGDYTLMMRELENLSGADLDKAFLEDMVHHHMGAIMMARSVQPKIEHEEIRTLTNTIIETQSAEITKMQTLRNTLK